MSEALKCEICGANGYLAYRIKVKLGAAESDWKDRIFCANCDVRLPTGKTKVHIDTSQWRGYVGNSQEEKKDE